jgi:hypothetical protein
VALFSLLGLVAYLSALVRKICRHRKSPPHKLTALPLLPPRAEVILPPLPRCRLAACRAAAVPPPSPSCCHCHHAVAIIAAAPLPLPLCSCLRHCAAAAIAKLLLPPQQRRLEEHLRFFWCAKNLCGPYFHMCLRHIPNS